MKREYINIKKKIKKKIEKRHEKYLHIDKYNKRMEKSTSNISRLELRANITKLPKQNSNVYQYNNLIDTYINKDKLLQEYDVCIVITTYNREDFLHRLLNNIEANKSNYRILIIVFDDASENQYDISQHNIEYVRYSINHGKWHYWKLITDTMQICKYVNSKYFIYLPDDVTIDDNFFEKSIDLYESIKDENKICLNLLMVKQQIGKTNWTNFNPIVYNENIYQTQWCDLCFISEKKMLGELDYKITPIPQSRWYSKKYRANRGNLSSGVGEDISKRLHELKHKMYHVKKSLVFHGDHNSHMNPERRKNEKLTT